MFYSLHLGIVGITAIVLALALVHCDIAAIANLGEQILNGGVPQRDFWDTNPPLFSYLNVPAVILARWLRVPNPYTVFFFCALTLALSLWQMRAAMKRFPLDETDKSAWLVLLAFLTWLLPSYDNIFAQREHLSVVLTLPYLIEAAGRVWNKDLPAPLEPWRSILIGLMAGVGFSIKPYFFLAWLFVEAYLAFQAKGFRHLKRVENAAIAAVTVTYGLLLIWDGSFLNAIKRIYLLYATHRSTVAEHLRSHIGNTWYDPKPLKILALAIVVAIVDAVRNPVDGKKRFGRILLLAAIAFAFVALIQRKPYFQFQYHHYPVYVFAFLSIAATVGRRIGMACSAMLALAVLIPRLTWLPERIQQARTTTPVVSLTMTPEVFKLYSFIRRHSRPLDPVLFFDLSPYPLNLAIAMARRENVTPGPDAWPLFAIYWAGDDGELFSIPRRGAPVQLEPFGRYSGYPQYEREFLRVVVRRMLEKKPKIIFFPRTRIDLVAYLSYFQPVRQLFTEYRRLPDNAVPRYEVWVR